jgi:TolB-like protein/tetratricopeptide (TPR) repeat protein
MDIEELGAYNCKMVAASGRVSFGAFELDLETGELWKSGRALKLRPQPARVLCLLVNQAGKLVSRDDIRRRLWDESTFVDYDVGVDYCVNRVRSVLCDKARAPRFIETLPRRGYRFIASVIRHRPFVEPTLAVLPFANLNGDPSTEYFADGVTDALIAELACIPEVRVISRQSVLHVKGSSRKLVEIALDLGVDGVVEGTVLHEGNRARVTAQLILMEPERLMWAQSYECDMSAVLSTQRDAARAISARVATALKPAHVVTSTPVPAPPEIIEIYFKARAELGKMSAEGIGRALQYFREIAIKAPGFALGLTEYALCLGSLGYWGHAPVREVYPEARQIALNALAIDDSIAVAHLVLGMAWLLDWDLVTSERELQRAIELSPSNPDARTFYAIFLSHVGRLAEATAEVQYALRLDPASLLPNTAVAWIYLGAGQRERAESQARRTIESFPKSLHAHFVLGWATWLQRRGAEAVTAFEKALRLSREAFSLAFIGHIYGCLGRKYEAKLILRELDQLFGEGHAPPIAYVMIHAGLGDADAAFDWLETACRLRDDKLFWLKAMPMLFDPLPSDPRFAGLVRRIGLAPASLAPTS